MRPWGATKNNTVSAGGLGLVHKSVGCSEKLLVGGLSSEIDRADTHGKTDLSRFAGDGRSRDRCADSLSDRLGISRLS